MVNNQRSDHQNSEPSGHCTDSDRGNETSHRALRAILVGDVPITIMGLEPTSTHANPLAECPTDISHVPTTPELWQFSLLPTIPLPNPMDSSGTLHACTNSTHLSDESIQTPNSILQLNDKQPSQSQRKWNPYTSGNSCSNGGNEGNTHGTNMAKAMSYLHPQRAVQKKLLLTCPPEMIQCSIELRPTVNQRRGSLLS